MRPLPIAYSRNVVALQGAIRWWVYIQKCSKTGEMIITFVVLMKGLEWLEMACRDMCVGGTGVHWVRAGVLGRFKIMMVREEREKTQDDTETQNGSGKGKRKYRGTGRWDL